MILDNSFFTFDRAENSILIIYIFVCESPKKPKISAAKMTLKLKFIFTKVPSSLSNFTALF